MGQSVPPNEGVLEAVVGQRGRLLGQPHVFREFGQISRRQALLPIMLTRNG
jgi:hypothetical protein